jgi:hypothetical protein
MTMDKDSAAPAGRDPENSGSPGDGSTIPQSEDGVAVTSTPGGSHFEPEEDLPRESEENLGEPDRES